jgi:hypothetical protein
MRTGCQLTGSRGNESYFRSFAKGTVMNKIIKIAFCIGLVAGGASAWAHIAAAGKPPSAPVVVTFIAGDVVAEPQPLAGPFTAGNMVGGPFTATIDFLKYVPYICPDSPPGGEAVLDFLQTQNPITYDSLTISTRRKKGALCVALGFRVTIDGVPYAVIMNAFLSGWMESTPTLDTIHVREGRFAVQSGNQLLVVAGTPVRQVNLDFSMTK